MDKVKPQFALWETGFRPFFLCAAVWAVVSMLIWFGVLRLNWQYGFIGLTPVIWHSHEMIYGFSMAVIAGFLLTAVPNWTGSRPVSGFPLMLLSGVWLVARIGGLVAGQELMLFVGAADLSFMAGLFLFVAIPIIRGRQVKQVGILVKIILMALSNLLFYLGAAAVVTDGMFYGLYTGFYLVIALILTLGRRVIPVFISRRLELSTPPHSHKWIDIGSLLFFLVFWIVEVFLHQPQWSATIALTLFALHSIRLYDWYHPRIWSDPLLWVLYVSYGFIVIGFALKASVLLGLTYSSLLALHLFAVGGIGMMTCGMMSRVSLGHTGRNIRRLPSLVQIAFIFISFSTLIRVFFPIVSPERYLLWIFISQWLWIASFTTFIYVYLPILIRPRVDGRRG